MIHKELSLGRIAGPFKTLPFDNFVISPLGLVPKKETGKYRIIHDLSFSKSDSVNLFISDAEATVQYESLDDIVKIVKMYGQFSLIAKTDIEEAFRLLPMHPDDYHLLGFSLGNNAYYYDKCLPMGLKLSCSYFEKLSCALQWIMVNKFSCPGVSHILDDFIFVGPPSSDICSKSLNDFLKLCEHLSVPIKHSKTCYPATEQIAHGIIIDTAKMETRLPSDKISKLRSLLQSFKFKCKCTLRDLQSLIGYLNFACKAVIPGRAFKRRISNLTIGVTKPHHHIRLTKEFRADVKVWLSFIDVFNGRSMFLEDEWEVASKLNFTTDASGFACAGFSGNAWFYCEFPESWKAHSIAVKELCPIVIGIALWGNKMKNRKVVLHSDNMSVVDVLNKQSARDPLLMNLVRQLVLSALVNNILFKCKHIPGIKNKVADHLSRSQFQAARVILPSLDQVPSNIPAHLLPWNWRP